MKAGSVVKWHTKVPSAQKRENERARQTKRKRTEPTVEELRKFGKEAFIRSREFTKSSFTRLCALVDGTVNTRDSRDHRTVHEADRLPRSLEEHICRTPPRFWVLDIPPIPDGPDMAPTCATQ